jgi:hypothetical protein
VEIRLHGAGVEQLLIPTDGLLEHGLLLGFEEVWGPERGRVEWTESRVRRPCSVEKRLSQSPTVHRITRPGPPFELLGKSTRTHRVCSSQQIGSDLRKLVALFVTGHAPRVCASPEAIADHDSAAVPSGVEPGRSAWCRRRREEPRR